MSPRRLRRSISRSRATRPRGCVIACVRRAPSSAGPCRRFRSVITSPVRITRCRHKAPRDIAAREILLVERGGLFRGLRLLRHRGHDVLILHVMDDEELDFNYAGTTRFEGMEAMGDLKACIPLPSPEEAPVHSVAAVA